jgi:hypothetical protein
MFVEDRVCGVGVRFDEITGRVVRSDGIKAATYNLVDLQHQDHRARLPFPAILSDD